MELFKKLFGSKDEHVFVRVISSEITKLRIESEPFQKFAADKRIFEMALKCLTITVARSEVPPEWKAATHTALAWTLVDESICDIGVGTDPSRLVSDSFYRYFDGEKLKEIELVCGPKSKWGLHII